MEGSRLLRKRNNYTRYFGVGVWLAKITGNIRIYKGPNKLFMFVVLFLLEVSTWTENSCFQLSSNNAIEFT